MKSLKSSIVVAALAASFTAHSEEFILDWNGVEHYENSAVTFNRSGEDLKVFQSLVTHSESGHKTIFFMHKAYKNKELTKVCEDNENETISVFTFNDQPVKMYLFCTSDNKLLYATPETDRGFDYVVNLFKRSPDLVNVKSPTFKASMSAVGFSKVWSSVHGDAI
ncbi:hypothetical protein [Vibrio sp. DNB22_19_2]